MHALNLATAADFASKVVAGFPTKFSLQTAPCRAAARTQSRQTASKTEDVLKDEDLTNSRRDSDSSGDAINGGTSRPSCACDRIWR